MWFVYIIECEDKSLYTGVAKDVKKRFEEHKNKKGAKYTQGHKPQRVVYIERKLNRSAAQKREAEIKNFTHQEKLNMIKNTKMPG